jgi:hypothetical protein
MLAISTLSELQSNHYRNLSTDLWELVAGAVGQVLHTLVNSTVEGGVLC